MKKIILLTCIFMPLIWASCKKDAATTEEPIVNGKVTLFGTASNAQTKAAIQGVLVTLMPGSINRFSGSDGTYQFDNLEAPAQYVLTAQADGYKPDRKTVKLEAGTIAVEANFVLQPIK